MVTASTLANGAADRSTLPKIKTPNRLPATKTAAPLTGIIADAIRDRWNHGGNFVNLADAIIDVLAQHIAKASMEKLDARISDAIEDHMSVEPKEGDVDAERECSVDDLVSMIAKVRATRSREWNGGAL